ncbi:MAG: hypothetical protein DRJ35_06750 [Thermoprotei archaeon]|nr:MAG: hypothetical protein DRJ35_06750 [Thermoprotei archaeon]
MRVRVLTDKQLDEIVGKILSVIEEEISKKVREPSYDIILNISDEWPYILDINLTIDSPFADDTIKDQVEEIMDIVTEKIRKIFEECGLKEAY